jgi:hypothetical protein
VFCAVIMVSHSGFMYRTDVKPDLNLGLGFPSVKSRSIVERNLMLMGDRESMELGSGCG